MVQRFSFGDQVHGAEDAHGCAFMSVELDGNELAGFCGRSRWRVLTRVDDGQLAIVDSPGIIGFEYQRVGPGLLFIPGVGELHRREQPCTVREP